MGKINVDGFLREYSVAAKQQGSAMETFIKKHIVTDYINIASKIAHCNVIIDNTCYIEDGGIKVIKFNRVVRHIWFIMKMIDLYTDIEINDVFTDYDKLNNSGAIGDLLVNIPESEYAEFSTILNMMIDDLRDNEYSITALLYNLKQSFSLSEEVITDVLNNPEVKQFIEEKIKSE